MTRKAQANKRPNGDGATLGFEAKLEQAADKLRNNEDPDEYRAQNIFGVPPVANANFAWVQHAGR